MKRFRSFVFVDGTGKAFYVKKRSKVYWLFHWKHGHWNSLREIGEADTERYRLVKLGDTVAEEYHKRNQDWEQEIKEGRVA